MHCYSHLIKQRLTCDKDIQRLRGASQRIAGLSVTIMTPSPWSLSSSRSHWYPRHISKGFASVPLGGTEACEPKEPLSQVAVAKKAILKCIIKLFQKEDMLYHSLANFHLHPRSLTVKSWLEDDPILSFWGPAYSSVENSLLNFQGVIPNCLAFDWESFVQVFSQICRWQSATWMGKCSAENTPWKRPM